MSAGYSSQIGDSAVSLQEGEKRLVVDTKPTANKPLESLMNNRLSVKGWVQRPRVPPAEGVGE